MRARPARVGQMEHLDDDLLLIGIDHKASPALRAFHRVPERRSAAAEAAPLGVGFHAAHGVLDNAGAAMLAERGQDLKHQCAGD